MSITECLLKGLVYTQGGKGVVLLFEVSFPVRLLKTISGWCQKMNCRGRGFIKLCPLQRKPAEKDAEKLEDSIEN